MTTVQNVFIMDEGDRTRAEIERRKFTVEEGDHLTLLNVYLAFVKSALLTTEVWLLLTCRV